MNKSYFEYFTRNVRADGVRKACYIVREYRRCEKSNDLENCAVTKEEFEKALDIISAFAYIMSSDNTTTKLWACKEDCLRNEGNNTFCPGEFQIGTDAKKRCKFYTAPRK